MVDTRAYGVSDLDDSQSEGPYLSIDSCTLHAILDARIKINPKYYPYFLLRHSAAHMITPRGIKRDNLWLQFSRLVKRQPLRPTAPIVETIQTEVSRKWFLGGKHEK